MFCETRSSQTEDVKVWNNKAAKGYIDKSCQKDGEIGGDEVQDECLLCHGSFITLRGLPILIIVKSSRNFGE